MSINQPLGDFFFIQIDFPTQRNQSSIKPPLHLERIGWSNTY